MMVDLFKKLNVLVKSSLNDLLGESDSPRRRSLSPDRLGKDIDRELAALRGQVNDAIGYEDGLVARVRELDQEVARWDAQADDAVARDDDASARYAVEQMKRAEQRRAMADADLRDHRLVTQELISRVNMLEAAVADARRAQAETSPQADAAPVPLPGRLLSDVLRETRERVAAMGDLLAAKDATSAATQPAPQVMNTQDVDDDLSRRRQRLSK